MATTRREVLRAAGTTLVLPHLPSLGWKAAAAEPDWRPPKRMVFLSFGWGVTNETWFPDKAKVGRDYELPEGLAPLARHKDRFTVIQGLSHRFSNDAHWGSTFWLTGANRYAVAGSSFSNSVSVDQVAAKKWGLATRFESLALSCAKAEESGHGPGLSLSWDNRGKPLAGSENPIDLFDKLFGDESIPLNERQHRLATRRSVLDAVMEHARTIEQTLSSRDQDKLDEYLQSVRDIEVRLEKEAQWMITPKPPAPVDRPPSPTNGESEIRLMYDLIVAALQTDSSRVVTYRQPVASLLRGLGIAFAPHDVSHYSPGARMEASQLRDTKQSELLAYLLDKLEGTKEADGSSLLDSVCLSYGSNIRSIHYLDNCPTLIAGGGAGISHGRHVVLEPKHTPLSNLWLTLLQGVGIDTDAFADSTGTLAELTA